MVETNPIGGKFMLSLSVKRTSFFLPLFLLLDLAKKANTLVASASTRKRFSSNFHNPDHSLSWIDSHSGKLKSRPKALCIGVRSGGLLSFSKLQLGFEVEREGVRIGSAPLSSLPLSLQHAGMLSTSRSRRSLSTDSEA